MEVKYELIKYDNKMHILYYKMNYINAITHWHTEIELLFVCSGSLHFTIDGKSYCLSTNEFALVNSGQIHSCESSKNPNDNFILMQINEHFFNNLHIDISKINYPNIYSSNNTSDYYNKSCRDMINLALQISNLDVTKQDEYKAKVNLLCCNIISTLMPYSCSNEQTTPQQHSFFYNTERMKRILSYIEHHYTEDLSISNIAEHEHLNEYYLSHCFEKYTNTTFTQYLNFFKIRKIQYDLLNTNDAITNIYLRHGFSNSKTFYRNFLKISGCSPKAFRNQKNSTIQNINGLFKLKETIDTGIGTYINYQTPNIPSNQKFLLASDKPNKQDINVIHSTSANITISINNIIAFNAKNYLKITGTGRANDFLKARFQKQFHFIQTSIAYSYIRFFGIFNKEMDVVKFQNEIICYHFFHVDEVLDCILENHCKPYITLGFTPEALRSGQTTLYFYDANTTPPKSLLLWKELIQNFMEHIIQRYSLEEVLTWIFEVWNEPDINFWEGEYIDYLELYKVTVETIKSIHSTFTVGGPALSSNAFESTNHLAKFLDYCDCHQLPVDFISLHPYPIQMKKDTTGALKQIMLEENNLSQNIDYITQYLSSTNYAQTPIHLNEWNSTPTIRDYVHDTAFMSSFILHNVLNNLNTVDALCYWCVSDLIDEDGVPEKEFCGSFGLLSRSGLKKPAFFAFQALSSLSTDILSKGNNYIVTKCKNQIQILIWNYCHYNDIFSKGDKSMLTYYDRYKIFDITSTLHFNIILQGIQETHCEIDTQVFDRENGSIYDFWLKNGAPEYFSPEQLTFYQNNNHLTESVKYETIPEQTLTVSVDVAPFGFTLSKITLL